MAAELTKPAVTPGRFRLALTAKFRGEFGLALLTMAVPSAVVSLVTRLWTADINVPFAYGGDATFGMMSIKDILDHGWYFTNPSLGAPLGQRLYDFPAVDNENALVIKVLSLFTNDLGLVTNLFYLLTFPLVALSALLVLRKLGLSRGAAFFSAVLFSLLPYHFERNEFHLFLSAYWAVPLGAYLALIILGGKALLARRPGKRGLSRYLSGKTLGTVACCIVVGSTNLYYAFFTILLVGAATLFVGAIRRSRSGLFGGLAVTGLLGVVLVINLAPNMVYARQHQKDSAAARNALSNWRQPQFTELFSVKLTYLVLPVDGHRLGFLSGAKLRYDQTTSPSYDGTEASSQTLGTIGDVGFFALLAVALGGCVGFVRWRPPPLLRHASFATIVAFLYGIVGGFATIVAYWINPNLHAPARISLFIAFFSLLAAGVLIDLIRPRLPMLLRRGGFAVVLAVLLVLGVLDQTTSHFKPDYASAASSWRSDAAFAANIQRTLPPNAAVFQLPYMAFPENGSFPPMRDYDLGRPYLHTHGLRWSYGAMKGTSHDWSAALATWPPEQLVPTVVAAGFSGLYLDRNGYPDSGVALESEIEGMTGANPIVSSDNRFAFFDLRSFARKLRARVGSAELSAAGAAVLHPSGLALGAGFYPVEQSGSESWQWSSNASSRLTLTNPSSSPERIRFSTTIRPRVDGSSTISISYPDGTHSGRRVASESGIRIQRDILIPPGTSTIEVHTNGPPAGNPSGIPGYAYLQFVNSSITSLAIPQLTREARAVKSANASG